MNNSVIRFPAVKSRCGISRSNIYQQINQGTFPKPIRLGERAVGWLTSDIDEWLSRQIEQRRLSQSKVDTKHKPPLTLLSDRTNRGAVSVECKLSGEVLK